jgi:hypothetical protein
MYVELSPQNAAEALVNSAFAAVRAFSFAETRACATLSAPFPVPPPSLVQPARTSPMTASKGRGR